MLKIGVDTVTEEARLGTRCLCGGCPPTATAYRDDPGYQRHDSKLAQGPCCCGRFFVIGADENEALARAEAMASNRTDGLERIHYELSTRRVALPWGGEVAVGVGDFAKGGVLSEIYAGAGVDDPQALAIDPVCLMEVVVGQAAAMSEHESGRYYFCAVGCRKRFDREPGRYLP
jgi:YHS domain-containing protein